MLESAGRAIDQGARLLRAGCCVIAGLAAVFGQLGGAGVGVGVLLVAYGVWIGLGMPHVWHGLLYLLPIAALGLFGLDGDTGGTRTAASEVTASSPMSCAAAPWRGVICPSSLPEPIDQVLSVEPIVSSTPEGGTRAGYFSVIALSRDEELALGPSDGQRSRRRVEESRDPSAPISGDIADAWVETLVWIEVTPLVSADLTTHSMANASCTRWTLPNSRGLTVQERPIRNDDRGIACFASDSADGDGTAYLGWAEGDHLVQLEVSLQLTGNQAWSIDPLDRDNAEPLFRRRRMRAEVPGEDRFDGSLTSSDAALLDALVASVERWGP